MDVLTTNARLVKRSATYIPGAVQRNESAALKKTSIRPQPLTVTRKSLSRSFVTPSNGCMRCGVVGDSYPSVLS
jgi:hypothetical protein